MDYARQNYIAQPGDGLKPKDYIRRLGPFDDFAINWGYRVLPAQDRRRRAEDAQRLAHQSERPFPYRYVPSNAAAIDPRSQTEDMGDDPVKATDVRARELQTDRAASRPWTTKPGEDYTDLEEIYGETSACGARTWATSPRSSAA